MEKILLIRPAQIRWSNEEKRLSQPLGILSIASYLKKSGFEVQFIDAAVEGYDDETEIRPGLLRFGLSENQLARQIEAINPIMVGISVDHAIFWEEARKMAGIAKQVDRNIIVVLGGNHVTGGFKEILEKESSIIDYICLGEGEKPMQKLAEFLTTTNGNPKDIKGVAYRKDGKIEYSFDEPFENLDDFPDPDFDLLKAEFYKPEMSHFGKPKAENFFTFLTQRGCSRGCHFCTSRYFFGSKVRYHSISRLKTQLEKIRALGFKQIVLQDDNALLFPEIYRRQYYAIPKELGLPAFHDSGFYYPLMTEGFIKELADCGIYGIYLPVESPSLPVMHTQGKYLELRSDKEQKKKLKAITRMLDKKGIEFYCGIMVGFPGESFDNLKNSVEFGRWLKQLGAFTIVFNWVHPYPGTPLYQKSYKLVPTERKWDEHPEFWNFIKPVFPIKGISLDDAEKYINERFLEINGSDSRNIGYPHQNKGGVK